MSNATSLFIGGSLWYTCNGCGDLLERRNDPCFTCQDMNDQLRDLALCHHGDYHEECHECLNPRQNSQKKISLTT